MGEFTLESTDELSEKLHNKAIRLVEAGNSSPYRSTTEAYHQEAQVYATLSLAAAMRESK